MWIELIAAIALGAGAAGVAMLARRLAPALPRWCVPAAMGLGMIGYAIWLDYAWFGQSREALPDGFEVVVSVEDSAAWKPWTYLAPTVSRFAAVDVATAKHNAARPDLVIADIVLFQRYVKPSKVPVLVDCPGRRRADISDGVDFDADGVPQTDRWIDLDAGDPLLVALCAD